MTQNNKSIWEETLNDAGFKNADDFFSAVESGRVNMVIFTEKHGCWYAVADNIRTIDRRYWGALFREKERSTPEEAVRRAIDILRNV